MVASDDDLEVAEGVRAFVVGQIDAAIGAALPGVLERIETTATTATETAVASAQRQFAQAEAAARAAGDRAEAMNAEMQTLFEEMRAEQQRHRRSLAGLAGLRGESAAQPARSVAAAVAVAPKIDQAAVGAIVDQRVGQSVGGIEQRLRDYDARTQALEEGLQWLEHAVALLAELSGVSSDRLDAQVRARAERRTAGRAE